MKGKRTGQKLWDKAKKLIPGGNQLLSKRSERFLPNHWPAYYSKAKGAFIWDLDGNKYLDMSTMGVGACILGYADPDVDRAVIEGAIKKGSMATFNAPEEIELAELLLKLHPWAGMVRYARTGGESMAVAARIARAYTGREKIAFCGYHGWADWYIATNLGRKDALADYLLQGLAAKGIPKGLADTMFPFHYNKIEELEAIVKEHPDLAAIIMEPVHGEMPKDGFLKKVKAIAAKTGAVFIFDEITVGFRMAVGGAHMALGVEPDMAVLGKSIANGYSMGAIIGRTPVMQAAQDTFISSTFWSERIGPVAALASIRKMRRINLPRYLAKAGLRMRKIWEKAGKKHGIEIGMSDIPALAFFSFLGPVGPELKTLFVQEMLKKGFLATDQFYPSYVHTKAHLDAYERALGEVFAFLAKAKKENRVEALLEGPVARPGFDRLN